MDAKEKTAARVKNSLNSTSYQANVAVIVAVAQGERRGAAGNTSAAGRQHLATGTGGKDNEKPGRKFRVLFGRAEETVANQKAPQSSQSPVSAELPKYPRSFQCSSRSRTDLKINHAAAEVVHQSTPARLFWTRSRGRSIISSVANRLPYRHRHRTAGGDEHHHICDIRRDANILRMHRWPYEHQS